MKEEIKEYIEELESLFDLCDASDAYESLQGVKQYIENLQSQLKAKEEAEKEFIKYLEDEIEKLKSEIFINALTSEDIDLYIMRIKLLKNEEILSKFNEILSKGENK